MSASDERLHPPEALDAWTSAALEGAKAAGARYAEVRLVRREREALDFKDGALERGRVDRDFGLGVRALFENGWGYAATNVLDTTSIARAGAAATTAARATAQTARYGVEVPEASNGVYRTPVRIDPLSVAVDEKAALFAQAHAGMSHLEGVRASRGSCISQLHETWFRATNGSVIDQAVTLCGGGVNVVAEHKGEVQKRSAPKSFEGNVLQAGWEAVVEMDIVGAAKAAADEAIALAHAPATPEGVTTIILGGAQLSLQIHESVGHPTELDRALGEEISLAGASFLLPDQLDSLQFGSSKVNLTADGTTPQGPGTFGFDDEGTPARAVPLVRDGRFVGYLSGRDAAARIGRPSGGALRAETWSRLPIVRMVNINLEPGTGSLDDLIGGVDNGLLLDTNKSWSIDDLRLNFQFSCEIAREIRGGKLTGRVFRNPVYRGVTPTFWGGCSAVAGPEAWKMWGWMFCGKGDPVQVMHVGHGCAPTRFDGVHVGST